MKRALVAAVTFAVGCASAGFHEGRTALRKKEQRYLTARASAAKTAFARFWAMPGRPSIVGGGLVRWEEGWACPDAPAGLLQAIRDELGRLNQRPRAGQNIWLTVTVYRFDRAGMWSGPTAYYELVARDPWGHLVWAADDKIEAQANLARTLADTSSAIIGREVLRKVRQQLGI